jgi:YD repeat-containing protein
MVHTQRQLIIYRWVALIAVGLTMALWPPLASATCTAQYSVDSHDVPIGHIPGAYLPPVWLAGLGGVGHTLDSHSVGGSIWTVLFYGNEAPNSGASSCEAAQNQWPCYGASSCCPGLYLVFTDCRYNSRDQVWGAYYNLYNLYYYSVYNSATYDTDCDGLADSQDQNPDTPATQLVKGGVKENPNTKYKDEKTKTQGCSKPTAQPSGMPGLVVNLASLNFVLEDKDIAYNDINGTIEIERFYNGYSTYQGIFGRGWTFNYGVRLVIDASGNVTVVRGSGAEKLFTRNADGTYTPPKGVYDKLLKNADGTFSLWSKDNRLTYAFSTAGVLTSVKDNNNNAVTLAYDGSGRLTTITDASGRATTFSYNGDGQVTTINDPLNRTITFTYESGNMRTSTDLAGVTTTFAYAANNFLQSMATPNGTTSFTYQDYAFGRRLATVTNPANLTTHYTIDAPNQEVLVTDAQGNTTHYGYNYDGYTTYVTDPLGNTISYGYDALGNRVSITDANNKKTTISYDSRGNITKIIDPLVKTTAFSYDTRDNLVQTTDALSRVYAYSYDTHDNLTRITNPLTQQTNFAYNTKGELISLTDAGGNTASFAYDQHGNLVTITDPLNHTATFTYNLIGQQQTATDPLGNTASFEYDPLGRLIKRIHPDSTQFIIERYCSGIAGIIDENGKHTLYDHNAINMLTKVHDPMDNQTSYTYDSAANLTQLTDPLNQATSYTYDAADRLVQTTYPPSRMPTMP